MSFRRSAVSCLILVVICVSACPASSLADEGDPEVTANGGGMNVFLNKGPRGGSGEAGGQGLPEISQSIHSDSNATPICGAVCTGIQRCASGAPLLLVTAENSDGTQQKGTYQCPGGEPSTAGPAPAAAPPQVTPAVALSAMRRVGIPAARLVIQPPNGKTLANFPTNFYTDAAPFSRTVTLLGQQVTLDIRPATYTWRFGDGQQTTTTTPGAAYPNLDITHTYNTEGTLSPSVDITYEADFRVNYGPTQPVPGTVTIAGDPVALTIVEARPELVGSY